MKVYALMALLIAFGAPFAFKADATDESYSFFVSLPGNASSYDDWLELSKGSTSAQAESEPASITTGRIIVNSAAGSLESRIFTRSISAGTALKSTDFGFMLIFR